MLVLVALLFPSAEANAGAHKDCQDNRLNTGQHADCERRYAELELAKLNNLTRLLAVKGQPSDLGREIERAGATFLAFVEADCLLKADTVFYGGTAATYAIEECRSDNYNRRIRELRPMLRILADMRAMRGG